MLVEAGKERIGISQEKVAEKAFIALDEQSLNEAHLSQHP